MGAEKELQLASSHCRAICDEIGDRLRVILDREAAPLPPRLLMLMQRLIEQDPVEAPPIAPSLDEMVWQPAASEPGSILAA